MKNISQKKLIAFDLDGTLAESKCAIDQEMARLLMKLLEKFYVAVISGGDYPQFAKQVLPFIEGEKLLAKLFLYPTCGTKAYKYTSGKFEKMYSEDLLQEDINKALEVITHTIKEFQIEPKEVYGELIENRGTQVTYSALGQKAPYELKKLWDPDFSKRVKIREKLQNALPHLGVAMGGATSIDITKKGIDKAYAIMKLKEELHIEETEMLFVGDALMKGGNDYAVMQAGVECVETKGPEHTKEIIKDLLN